MSLTNKQKIFVQEYLKTFNATQAAISAGYSPRTAGSIGSENLTKPAIKEVVDRFVNEGIRPDFVANNTAHNRQARATKQKVYLIREGFRGLVKIGIAKHPQKRLSSIQTACPQDIELVGYVESSRPKQLERELHRRFHHKHYRGEWFELSQDDIDLILTYHNGTQKLTDLPLFSTIGKNR